MSLYIDYRPDTLDGVFGNEATVAALKSVLSKKVGEIPHAFCFFGPSGTGKTTLARIVASRLGCGDMDLVEINAANNRGIDTAREIIQASSNLPMSGKCRVFLMDEFHMCTKDFQNALLKPLEDTPSHTYYILCTTAPEGIITAVKNRCTSFKLSPLETHEMIELLTGVCDLEEVNVPEVVIKKIAQSAEGSARQGLVILEQVMGLSEGEMEAAISAAGVENAQTIELCRALVGRKEWRVVATLLKGLDDDPERARRAVLGYFNAVLLGSYGDKADYAALVIESFSQPFYNTGKAGLARACYMSVSV